MSEVTTDQMNEAIAIFDGWEFKAGDPNHKCPYCIGGDEPCTPAVDRFYKCGHVVFHYQLKYHTSWDALMPVCHKIREAVFELRGNEKVANLYHKLNTQLMYGTIADVLLKAYNLITWLNQQTTTNEQ